MTPIQSPIKRPAHALRDKSFEFAFRIARLYRYLSDERKEFIFSKQILRSGTNPGSMIREAINAESGLDFVHKLSIAQKETGETQYWLELLFVSGYLNESEFNSMFQDSEVLMKLIRSSILTKKKNMLAKTSALILVLSILSITHLLV